MVELIDRRSAVVNQLDPNVVLERSGDVFGAARPSVVAGPEGSWRCWVLLSPHRGGQSARPERDSRALRRWITNRAGGMMSLTTTERQATRAEFKRNFELLGLKSHDVATVLGVDDARIEGIMSLRRLRHLEDAWILRDFLLDCAHQAGVELSPFTALRGNPEEYYFLDTERIHAQLLD
jgi:hypothetical protein